MKTLAFLKVGRILLTEEEYEFLKESNAIESEYSEDALEDAAVAWDFLKGECCMPPLQMILESHKLLMKRLRPDIAGKMRNCAVYIGGHEAPDYTLISGLLNEWISKYITKPSKTPKRIKEAHVAFEHIHPFEDGNGRTGRLLMNLQRVKAKLGVQVIHEGAEQSLYYKWFA